jgi:hypothetical protein
MDEIVAYREDLLSALEGALFELPKTVAGIASIAWHQPFGRDSHTPHYILEHLRELEAQVFAIQLRRILDEEIPLVPVFDDDAWMAIHYKPEELALTILEDFVNLRKQELNWLRKLSPAAWSRIARHPWWGVHTLQWWVELQLDYSDQHLRELSPVLDL